jgi:hypothetical protein
MDQPIQTLQPQTRRRRRRSLVVLLLALSLGTIGAGVFSLAIFTDTDTTTGAFSTGTVDIATTPTALFTVAGMLPGDSGSANLTVANNGTAQLRYAMTSVSTNADAKALRDQLTLSIKAGACPGAGAALYSATLNGAVFGSTVQGAQAGDRTLASGTNEVLCFAWALPAATGNAYQGATTTATFTFAAEQTANNP